MRHLFALLAALCLALPAAADTYNLSVTMPCVQDATQSRLYVNDVGQALKTCGNTAQSFPGLIPAEGTYSIAYAGATARGTEGGKSPAATFVIEKKPATPTNPPGYTVSCRDAQGADVACPPNITITKQ